MPGMEHRNTRHARDQDRLTKGADPSIEKDVNQSIKIVEGSEERHCIARHIDLYLVFSVWEAYRI